MDERRIKFRAETAVAGHATFPGREAGVQCVALNFSPSGACLTFPSEVAVPRLFSLALGLEPASSAVRVLWRQHYRVGVAFVAPRAVPDVVAG